MFFSIGSHFVPFSVFQYWEPLRRRKKGVGVQRDEEEKKEIEKLGLRVNVYFPVCVFLSFVRK